MQGPHTRRRRSCIRPVHCALSFYRLRNRLYPQQRSTPTHLTLEVCALPSARGIRCGWSVKIKSLQGLAMKIQKSSGRAVDPPNVAPCLIFINKCLIFTMSTIRFSISIFTEHSLPEDFMPTGRSPCRTQEVPAALVGEGEYSQKRARDHQLHCIGPT